MKYHADIGIPSHVNTKYGVLRLNYSAHALQAAHTDRYSEVIQLPATLDTDTAQVIEVERNPFDTIKVVYRIHYNAEYDLVLVVLPTRNFVKTVWLNHKNDTHKTLRRNEYDSAG